MGEIGDLCSCYQGQHGTTKWCKHYVAVELWKRTQTRLYGVHAGGNDHQPGDEDLDVGGLEGQPEPQEPEVEPADGQDDPEPSHHWAEHEPPVVWHVEFVVDGVKHGVTIRCDDLQETKAQVKELTAMIKKGREQETIPTPETPSYDKHKVHFERHSNSQGS